MNKIFLKSDKFSHIAGVTLQATNRLARKSLCNLQLPQSATLATGPKTGSSKRLGQWYTKRHPFQLNNNPIQYNIILERSQVSAAPSRSGVPNRWVATPWGSQSLGKGVA